MSVGRRRRWLARFETQPTRWIGRREAQKVTADAGAGINGDLGSLGYIALRRVLSFAVRRGYITENHCSKLEKGERPKVRASVQGSRPLAGRTPSASRRGERLAAP